VPNNASHKKRLRQSRARRLKTRRVRSEVRTRRKHLHSLDDPAEASQALSELYRVLDRASRKRVIPRNTAARQKASAARHVQTLVTSG